MSYPGARLVLFCCFLMHFSWFSSSYFVLQLSSDQFRLFVDCVQALTYLSTTLCWAGLLILITTQLIMVSLLLNVCLV